MPPEPHAADSDHLVTERPLRISSSLTKQRSLLGKGRNGERFFILPDCSSPGMPEGLCLQAVDDCGAMQCVDTFFECMKCEGREPGVRKGDKARVHARFSAATRPGLRLGEAAETGEWNFNHETVRGIQSFLRLLSSQPTVGDGTP